MNNTDALFGAIRGGQIDMVRGMITESPELVNTADARKFTPLVMATYMAQREVTELLIAHGANLEARDGKGNTALMGVAFKGDLELVDLLIEASADLNKQNYEGATALTYAIDYGHFEIAKLLLAKGADTNTQDAKGKSPLQHAELQSDARFVALFE